MSNVINKLKIKNRENTMKNRKLLLIPMLSILAAVAIAVIAIPGVNVIVGTFLINFGVPNELLATALNTIVFSGIALSLAAAAGVCFKWVK